MFTTRITPPKFVDTDFQTLDIYDPLTDTIVYTCDFQGGKDIIVELNGNKYDNKLKYSFTSIDIANDKEVKTELLPISPGGIGAALKLLDPSSGGNFQIEVLEGASAEEITYFMRNILMRGYQKLLLRPDNQLLGVYSQFLSAFKPQLRSYNNEIEYVHQILSVLVAYLKRCESRGTSVEILDEKVIDRLIANYCRSAMIAVEKWSTFPGLLVAKGHLVNLSSRKVAADCYAKALELGASYLNTFLRVDALTTFFSEVPAGYSPPIVTRNPNRDTNDTRINLCFSVDPKYFRMYAPLWAATSAFYNDIVFNYLIVTETREEFEKLASEYETILNSCDSLVGVNKRRNVNLYWLENDKSYGRTLFACARFYLAKKVLAESAGGVFVCDIDQFVIGDLSKFLRETAKSKSNIQLALVENYFALLPGRSHLAGYIHLRNSREAQMFIDDVTDYIAEGLGVNFSWMLDQNAVRYASERTTVSHLDMRSVRVFGHYGAHKDALRSRIT